jgi:hypothetical protein
VACHPRVARGTAARVRTARVRTARVRTARVRAAEWQESGRRVQAGDADTAWRRWGHGRAWYGVYHCGDGDAARQALPQHVDVAVEDTLAYVCVRCGDMHDTLPYVYDMYDICVSYMWYVCPVCRICHVVLYMCHGLCVCVLYAVCVPSWTCLIAGILSSTTGTHKGSSRPRPDKHKGSSCPSIAEVLSWSTPLLFSSSTRRTPLRA